MQILADQGHLLFGLANKKYTYTSESRFNWDCPIQFARPNHLSLSEVFRAYTLGKARIAAKPAPVTIIS